ncbi:hypothetical protein [Pedobacter gandavensis]|uniref:hypothetical protein n=1 Tax=Pedobacter gandavensis TaxID=2679963 RepID=UPI00292F6276|nr:hypothetical protein [Pedobacter gandavensis]
MKLDSGQAVNEVFFDALDACCKEIIEKMGGKPISEWRTTDYNSLSSQLGKKTKVYLSENTLKRIFGRLKTSNRYYPQKATRDALAQFIGYRDWQEYELICIAAGIKKVESPTEEEEPQIQEVPENTIAPLKAKSRSKQKMIGFGLIALTLLIIASFFIFQHKDSQELNPYGVSLVCENPIGEVPHTAVFKLASKKPLDEHEEFSIDFMDEGAMAKISGKKEKTQFFMNPGVVYVKLLYKGVPIDTATIYMQTKGWVANSGNDTLRAFPIAGLRSLSEDRIFVSAKQLDSAGLNLSKPFLVGFSNIHSSNISGENFEFSCNLESEESRPGVQCIESTVIILGENSRHLITMYKPSCAAFSEYNFSEVKVNGATKYLGGMGYDFKDGGEFKLRVKDKNVSLFLGGKEVLKTSYKLPIGKVTGIKVLFNGIGRLRVPKLQDLKTGELY